MYITAKDVVGLAIAMQQKQRLPLPNDFIV